MKKWILFGVCCLFSKTVLLAQAPSDAYLKSLNSYVTGSPEAAQIMKYQDYPVNLFTGTPDINIPIYTLSGKGIAVPISLSYHAGGGVKIDEQASNIGLGWLLHAGGEITREVRGNADEAGNGYLNKPNPISFYVNKTTNGIQMADIGYWTDAQHGFLDLEPDIFYFSFGSFSGKFIYDDSLQQFICISQKGSVKINLSFVQSNSVWTIVTDDGNKYIFANREASQSVIENMTGSNGTQFSDPQTSSWKLSKIINADATDSIMFNYNYNAYHYYSPGANTSYQLLQGSTGTRPTINSYSYNYITGISKLTGITGTNASVSFTDDVSNRQDMMDNQKALSKIIIKNRDNSVMNIFKMNYSYFDRQNLLGSIPGNAIPLCKKSLKLDGLTEYGTSESNPNPLIHTFTYNSTLLPCRMSFAKDFWGYANSNTTAGLLAPDLVWNGVPYNGANRYTDTIKEKAGILEKITLPTGGTVQFNYESNTLGYPIQQAATDNIIFNPNNIAQFKAPMELFQNTYETTFTVNQPDNFYINQGQGGVIADLSIYPAAAIPPGAGNPPAITNDAPYFELAKISNSPGGDPNMPLPSYILQYNNKYNVPLSNGTYKMKVYNCSKLNASNILNTTRAMSFTVGYKTLDTGQQANYKACGLRIRSIVTSDPYTNKSRTRNFRYHDPETDSSYGRFIGSTLSSFVETLQDGNGRYLVRTGSYNIPGMGSVASSITYLKVIEEVSDSGTLYRTEHYYSTGIGFYPRYSTSWPFEPSEDIECGRGNEEMTIWKQYASGNFTDARIRKQVFDFNPHKLEVPAQAFARKIYGIKCTSDSYVNGYDNSTGGSQMPPQNIRPYYTNINRLYLTSDSVVTYDLNNQYRAITQWHDYTYGDFNQQPVIIQTGNSDGSVSVQKNWYAADQPEPSSEINATLASQMVLANRVSQPLGTKIYKDNQLLSQQFTYAHFNGNRLLTDSMRQAIFSNPLETEIKVLQYDSYANPLTAELRGGKFRKYIWNGALGLPLATCVTSQNGAFFFTSFEYPSEYPSGVTNTAHFSGSYAYQLTGANNITLNGFNSSTGLEVYAWTTGAGFSANGTPAINTGITSGAWTLYKASLGASVTAVTISGGSMIDQLAVLPTGSSFEGNVYDSAGRIVSKVTNDMQTIFFEYDNFGRLTMARDMQGNIIKSSSYQYQGGQ